MFSECEHRRKERFFDYSDFYCCADCGYHFVDGDPKYRHPSQYEDCKHSHKEKIDDRLTCLRCGLRLNGPSHPPPLLKYSEYYKICKHLCFDDINGNIYCTDCGHIDRVELINEHYEDFDHYVEEPNHCKDEKVKPVNNIPKKCKNKNLTKYSKVKELRKAATDLGIKCTTIMSKKQLCEVLGIEISNEGKHILKNTKTGEEHKFKTLKRGYSP